MDTFRFPASLEIEAIPHVVAADHDSPSTTAQVSAVVEPAEDVLPARIAEDSRIAAPIEELAPPPVANVYTLPASLQQSALTEHGASSDAPAERRETSPPVPLESILTPRIASGGASPRAPSDSSPIGRAPPKQLARRASMVSFRVSQSNASFGGTPSATPRNGDQSEDLIKPIPRGSADVPPAASEPNPPVAPLSNAADIVLVVNDGTPQASTPQQRRVSVTSSPALSDRIAPVVPKRAGSLTTKFQDVVRQKLAQERELKHEADTAADAARQQQRELDDARIARLEAAVRADEEARRASEEERKVLISERDLFEQARAEFAAERAALETEREKMHAEIEELLRQQEACRAEFRRITDAREAIAAERRALEDEQRAVERKKIQARSVSGVASSPERASWMSLECVVSPDRTDFQKMDPMMVRRAVMSSAHHASFSYEPPSSVTDFYATRERAEECRSKSHSVEELVKAQALRTFEPWQPPARYEPYAQVPPLRVEPASSPSSSVRRIEYRKSASPSGNTPKQSADEYIDVETPPNYRLFSSRRTKQ